MESSSDLLQKLKLSANLSDEVVNLETLQLDLKPSNHHQQRHDYDPDEEWLSMAVENLGDDDDDEVVNPFPKMIPNQLFTHQDDLNQFTCYVFMRRFGWSEGINGETVQDERSVTLQKGKLAMEKEAQCKARVNELLDEFIKWYLSQPVSQPLLQSLRHTFKEAINKPVVRNQTVVHVMEWLRHRIGDRGAHQHIEEVYQLMLCGLTDIWSAIRNAAVSRLAHVIDGFSLSELQVFFMSLAQICQSKESTWQSIEGALMAITGILKRFQWTGKLASSSVYDVSGGTQFILKFGKQELSQLPEFLTSHMHTIVYPLLAHRQLSIRENATKAFSAFLSRCEVKEALTSFTEALTRLRHGTGVSPDQSSLPHLAVLRKDYRFLNAYEAEGLLGVCVYLIKHISPGFLLPNWPEYFSIFNLYLMHPASTVRQATSAVFKYLVAKDSNNPSMLKLVLQALCADWDMNYDLLTRDTTAKSTIYSSDLHSNGSESNPISRSQATDATRSTAGSDMELRQQRKRHISTSGGKYCSVTSLCALEDDSTDSLFSKAWEWREGRLLAYELIVKFLIINHIHYLFPSYALPPSKFDGTVSTDDSLTPSHQSRMVIAHKPVQKSVSHGGTTLRQMMSSQGALRKTMSQDEALVEQDESNKKERSGSDHDLQETTMKVNEMKGLTRSGSDRRKRTIEERRSRTLAEGHMYNRPIPKHYSYYANSSHGNLSKKQNCIASSLLEQTRYMDKDLNKLFSVCESKQSMCVKSVISRSPLHDMNSPPQDVIALLNAIKALEKQSSGCTQLPNWLQYLDLDSMSNILCQMLLQTIGCLGDTRWELRRMGHQTTGRSRLT
ncbi:uncharacterized protein [Amphiura filiformis]|uniref:uncharacterized protein n=1 Tax=Amphiura filiformis TaxID=82378 RepID=UPI003B21FFC8